jgi:putative transposase
MPLRESTIVDVREEMALKALSKKYTVTELAEMFDTTRPTVRLWRDRYREEGRAGLTDRSHAAHTCPHRSRGDIEELVLAERAEYGWGSKKILARLKESHPDVELPSRSAIDAILSRHGLVKKQRRRSREMATPFRRRYEASEPGELMTIDHKGQFRLLDGSQCYPLTIVDHVSRYLLSCTALPSTALSEAWPVIKRVFREHGLPVAMQSDNGPPFGAPNGRFSTLSVRLMMLNVLPVFGRPAHPEDNGRHERMHRDLKCETTLPPAATMGAQQKRFNEFNRRYNVERPHEGLGMQRPARVFQNSPRPYPHSVAKPQYDAHVEVRKVSSGGRIKWQDESIFISEVLKGQLVGVERTGDGICTLQFYRFTIGKIDEREKLFV